MLQSNCKISKIIRITANINAFFTLINIRVISRNYRVRENLTERPKSWVVVG